MAPKNLKLYYTNANGLFNKFDELKTVLSLHDFDVACITETHFNKDIMNSEISIDGFDIFRRDRDFLLNRTKKTSNVSAGGGSVIFVRSDLNASRIETFNAPDSVAINFMTNSGKVNIACVYRSPSLTMDQNQSVLSCIKKHVLC